MHLFKKLHTLGYSSRRAVPSSGSEREIHDEERSRPAQITGCADGDRRGTGLPRLHPGPRASRRRARLEEIDVTAQRIGLVGESRAASEGIVLAIQLEGRPVLRPGEVLEVVPGLIVTQHSGDGKANQYFLRGFNLDHGTDFATRVDGIPVNMPTHAHGQGYADINFLIPELVDEVRYRKGTYFADEGNFSAAGAADIVYRRRLDASLAEPDDRRGRLLPRTARGCARSRRRHAALARSTTRHADGPWDLPQDFRKVNGLRSTRAATPQRGFAVTAMGYDGALGQHRPGPGARGAQRLRADPVLHRPLRLRGPDRRRRVAPLQRCPFGRLVAATTTATAGRRTPTPWTTTSTWSRTSPTRSTRTNGDQFEQYDDRSVYGGRFEHAWPRR